MAQKVFRERKRHSDTSDAQLNVPAGFVPFLWSHRRSREDLRQYWDYQPFIGLLAWHVFPHDFTPPDFTLNACTVAFKVVEGVGYEMWQVGLEMRHLASTTTLVLGPNPPSNFLIWHNKPAPYDPEIIGLVRSEIYPIWHDWVHDPHWPDPLKSCNITHQVAHYGIPISPPFFQYVCYWTSGHYVMPVQGQVNGVDHYPPFVDAWSLGADDEMCERIAKHLDDLGYIRPTKDPPGGDFFTDQA